MKIFHLFVLLLFFSHSFSQEIGGLNKTKFENSYNTKYLGNVDEKHFVLEFNVNVFRNEVKDIDEDKIKPKTILNLVVFNEESQLETKYLLAVEYKFQEILFAGLVNNNFTLIYTSRKGKGTIQQNFDLTGKSIDFKLLSAEKKRNYFKVTDSSKYFLHFAKENCYVFDHTLKNIDKFPYPDKKIVDIINYQDGFIILSESGAEVELTHYSQSESIAHQKINENTTWVFKNPRLSSDPINTDIYYLTYLLGKKEEHSGGWDLTDTRQDGNYRSKGIRIHYYDGWLNKTQERSILFESNIIYGTNSKANTEKIMGCTYLRNQGVYHYENSIIIVLEEQLMHVTETINPLTSTKKVVHKFKYNDLIFIKAEKLTSIQNFLIKGCHLNMEENRFGSFNLHFHGVKIKVLYNQTYLREGKNKLLIATLDMYLDTESKVLNDSFNDSGLNLVLNPTERYVKSKYFLALQTGFLDLTFLEE